MQHGSPYRIIERIGAGGMGEVYRARDTRLERDVAVKRLPEKLAGDLERVERLRREAKVLAALNHPHIAAVYDLYESEGQLFVVLELVPGHTLADRLARGPMPVREALHTAIALADALDAAHERGIVHRDVKPGNIKVTPDGRLKLLDFGLASSAAGVAQFVAADDATREAEFAASGVVSGTLPYMSPEQLRGEPIDKRSDIWSFGCVLYELLNGRPPFAGPTADVIASILSAETGTEPAGVPGGDRLSAVVRRCLLRDLRQRFRDIGDVRHELEEILSTHARPSRVASPGAARGLQFHRLTDAVGLNSLPAVSPDGKMVAYVAAVDGVRQILVRLLAGGAPLQVTRDPVDHAHPRWTPDSSALVFHRVGEDGARGCLCEVPALGGFEKVIVPFDAVADVSHDGTRLVMIDSRDGRPEVRITERDGTPIHTVGPLPPASTLSCPRWSPDDSAVAFTADQHVFDQQIHVAAGTGGPTRVIVRAGLLRGLAWLPGGSGLIYSSSAGSTMLYPPIFNLRAIATDGSDDRAITAGDNSFVEPDVDASGRVFASRLKGQSDIWSFPVDGSPQENTRSRVRVTHQTGQVQTPSVSPDGRRIVYLSDNGGRGNLWVARTDGTGARQITFDTDPDVRVGVPVWSPAGDEIAYVVTTGGQTSLWIVRPDGSGRRQLVERGFAGGWSADGRWLYYTPGLRLPYCIEKVPVAGGAPILVRDDDCAFVGALPGGTGIVFARRTLDGEWNWRVMRATPEDGDAVEIAVLLGSMLPVSSGYVHSTVSPNGQWLATPLMEGVTTNVWRHPIGAGTTGPISDFGDRPTVIARRVSWAPDSQRVYAAVNDIDADIVLLEGLF